MSAALLTPSRQVAVREDWLALTGEPILDPDLPIIDPHHHLWDHPGERYLLPDLLRDTASGHRIEATVFVQCGAMYRAEGPEDERPLGETEFVTQASGRHGGTHACAGIIGMVDLTLGDRVAPLIEAHRAIAGPLFRGVRNRTAWHPSPEIRSNLVTPPPGPLEHPGFADGARQLARAGLTLDVWAYHTQLPLVLALARAVPELAIILDHCGGPLGVGPFAGRRAEVFPAWRESILALAALPNMAVKLGGLAMQVNGFDFHLAERPPGSAALAEAWRPYIETCIEAFGPARSMFESNFPVDKGMCGYPVLWNSFKRLASGASAEEKTALFHGTAARIYGLPSSFSTSPAR
ncbi:amidohydrolase [Belnapia sp. F-4-1]|uniref:amidohydrolase family protein n=1 Tax=Belnapia sp. F-4-1 TaxID=1545443 RepID=UPI0005BE1BA5|nr:amidohydrolase family protein [Belnapia sp. F-4-1]